MAGCAAGEFLERDGPGRAHHIIEQLIHSARIAGVNLPFRNTTAYVNTIPVEEEDRLPGDTTMEHRVRSLERWNALAMVVKANKRFPELGGHISTYASAATLISIGFNHFFRPARPGFAGDLVYFQGHAAPGVYARAFLEGRLDEEQLLHFRRENAGPGPVVLPASLADARFLAVSDRVHGAGPDHGHLSGALHELPA